MSRAKSIAFLLLLAAVLVRTFGGSFTTQKNLQATPAPFMTVVYHFAEGDLWLSERVLSTAIPGIDINPIIISLGQIGTALARAPEIVDVGDSTISFCNFPVLVGDYAGRSFSDLLGADIESVDVDFYANFILPDDTVVSEIFASGVSRFNFHDEQAFFDEEVGAIVVTSITEKWWQRNVLKVAGQADYPNIDTSNVGKNFPLPMGDAVKVPGLRLDATADRYTLGESDPANPVTSIGRLYWNGHPFVEQDVAFGIPLDASFFNLNLVNGVATPGGPSGPGEGEITGNSGVKFNGGSPSVSAILNVADGITATETHIDFWQPFSPKQDCVLTGINPSVDAFGTGGTIDTTRVYYVILEDEAHSQIQIRSGNTNSVSAPIPFYAILRAGRKYFVHYVISTAGRFRVATGISFPIDSGYDAYFQDQLGEHALNKFPGVPYYTTGICQQFYGFPLGTDAGLAADSDPLGVVAAVGQKLTEPLESPGIVLEGIRVALRAPVTADDHLDGDLKLEVLSLQNGQTTSVCSTTITSEEFMDGLDDAHRSIYVPFYQTLDEPVFLPAGRVAVQITNDISITQVAAEAEAVSTGPPSVKNWAWAPQGYSTPSTPPAPHSVAMLTPAPVFGGAPRPTLGPSSVPVRINIVLYAMKFDRLPNSAVRPTEGTTGAFNVASVTPQPAPYRISETRRVPIPSGVTIAGDLACTYSRCDQVIHALANRAGTLDARIDLAGTFAATGTKCAANGYRFDGAITSQQTYKAAFTRMTFESRLVADWQWDKMQLKWTPSRDEVTASVKTFNRSNILPKADGSPVSSLKVKRTTEKEIVNVIRARWKRDLVENSFDAAERFESAPSIAVHGELSRDDLFDFLYVRSDAMIASVCPHKLERMAFSKRLFEWEAFLDSLGIEKEDPVDYNMVPSGGGGGGTGIGEGGVGEGGWGGGPRVFAGLAPGTFSLVEKVNYNWQNFKTVLLEAREL